MIPVFTNVGKGLQLKTIDLLDFSVVSKVFISQVSLSVAYLTVANLARLVNMIVNHLEKCGFRASGG